MSDSDDTDIIVDDSKFKTMRTFVNWPFIKDLLRKMADGMMNSSEIIETLSRFKSISYKNRYGKKRVCKDNEFDVLMEEYDDQLPQIFCKIAIFVLRQTTFQYPLFNKGLTLEHTFRKEEVLFLLCSMTLQLIPKQQYHTPQKQRCFSYQLDFSFIFKHSQYKTKAIIEFLKQQIENQQSFKDNLTIKRRSIPKDINSVIKQNGDSQMKSISIKPDNDSIEEYYGQVKVDFANRYIGGGSLSNGCVQEQIMFANHPELFISQLLCEVLEENQAIFFIGFKKYNKNQGYGYNTKFGGIQNIPYQYDNKMRAKQFIVAIDALCFEAKSLSQFKVQLIQRQILKAYCGFSIEQAEGLQIVSGNWGCGAFGGNIQLKFLIQWIACTLARRELIYCPFGSSQHLVDKQLFQRLSSINVGQVMNFLLKTCTNINREIVQAKKKYEEVNVFSSMLQLIKSSQISIAVD